MKDDPYPPDGRRHDRGSRPTAHGCRHGRRPREDHHELHRRGREIISTNPDGSGQATVFDIPSDWAVGRLDVTDDGSMVAMTFLPRNTGHIYVGGSDGSGVHRLTTGGDDADPSFSPAGDWLVFTRYGRLRSNLYRIRADGSDLKRLTSPAEPEAEFATWSADGDHMFVDRGGRRERLIVADHGVRTLHVIYRATTSQELFTTAWSPDGSTIVFGVYGPAYDNAELWAIAPDGTGLTQLTDSSLSETSPAFSPDGSRIAASLTNESTGGSRLLVMDADGTDRGIVGSLDGVRHVAWGGTPPG